MRKISVGIVGYGNLGRGVKEALVRISDLKLALIWTRRFDEVRREVPGVPILSPEERPDFPLDAAILCRDSKDLLRLGPEFARSFNTVDSFDMHASVPSYFKRMDRSAKCGGKVSVISAGWDPGMFSVWRYLGDTLLGKTYTFWGKGVSMGHSAAACTVRGVKNARAYTIPVKQAIERIRKGETPDLPKREMIKRVVYVVAEKGSDRKRIKGDIISIPEYFAEYDTEVKFISRAEMEKRHSKLSHGGSVFASGQTGKGNRQLIEFRCQLESNPEFTGCLLVTCARAAHRLNREGKRGAFTLLDIPASYLSPHSPDVLRRRFI